MAEEMLRAIDIASCLGLTTGRVYQLAQDGTIPHVRWGKRSIRFPRQAWLAWLSEQEAQAVRSIATAHTRQEGKPPLGGVKRP